MASPEPMVSTQIPWDLDRPTIQSLALPNPQTELASSWQGLTPR
jgi:hypothetical protein